MAHTTRPLARTSTHTQSMQGGTEWLPVQPINDQSVIRHRLSRLEGRRFVLGLKQSSIHERADLNQSINHRILFTEGRPYGWTWTTTTVAFDMLIHAVPTCSMALMHKQVLSMQHATRPHPYLSSTHNI